LSSSGKAPSRGTLAATELIPHSHRSMKRFNSKRQLIMTIGSGKSQRLNYGNTYRLV
jgi:hypothetical protein